MVLQTRSSGWRVIALRQSIDSQGKKTPSFSPVHHGEVSVFPEFCSFHQNSCHAGTSYGEDDVFDLTKMEPYNLEKLYKSFTKYSNEVVLYLPRNSDLNQIAKYVPEDQKLEVAHYAIMGASKACIVGLVWIKR